VSATAAFTVRFANPPGQAAPIVSAHWLVCPAGSSAGCHSGTSAVAAGGSGQQNAISGSFGIAQPGAYTIALWLEDAAGNVDQSTAAPPVRLQLGEDTPPPPLLDKPYATWLSASTYTQHLALAPGAVEPASGVAGYAVTTDGSLPGQTVNAAGKEATYTFAPAEGTTTIRARTVSGAGSVSDVAETALRVDRTPPATSVLGAGAPGATSGGPLDLTLLGTDQPGLSGMGGADPDRPLIEGAHVDYQLDGGPIVQVRGDEATLHLMAAGAHTIAFRAYDVAQNASPLHTLTVNVGEPSQAGTGDHRGFWHETTSTASFSAAASFATTCPPQATLQAAADATIDQRAPGTSAGGAPTLTVRSQAAGNARALLAFDLPAKGDCELVSAELRLHQESGAAGRTLAAYRLGSAWDATSVSWDDRPGPTGVAATATGSGSGPQAIDVTEQVRGMYRSGNAGLVVEDAAEGAETAAAETFSAARSPATQHRPQLVLTFG
jgi:hypothetical protein